MRAAALEEKEDTLARSIKIGSYTIELPASRLARIGLGVVLIIFGIFGFLPVVGFWMIPLGILVLSYDIAIVRRLRRRVVVWWNRTEGA